jgi:hypothetical protein
MNCFTSDMASNFPRKKAAIPTPPMTGYRSEKCMGPRGLPQENLRRKTSNRWVKEVGLALERAIYNRLLQKQNSS